MAEPLYASHEMAESIGPLPVVIDRLAATDNDFLLDVSESLGLVARILRDEHKTGHETPLQLFGALTEAVRPGKTARPALYIDKYPHYEADREQIRDAHVAALEVEAAKVSKAVADLWGEALQQPGAAYYSRHLVLSEARVTEINGNPYDLRLRMYSGQLLITRPVQQIACDVSLLPEEAFDFLLPVGQRHTKIKTKPW